MSRSAKGGAAAAILIGFMLAGVAIGAFSNGYQVGKDIAAREDARDGGAH